MLVNGIKFYWEYNHKKRTITCIAEQGGNILYKAKAICHKDDVLNKSKDFDKNKGRILSLTRVLNSMKVMQFDKEFRTLVWETYRTLPNTPRWYTKSEKLALKV